VSYQDAGTNARRVVVLNVHEFGYHASPLALSGKSLEWSVDVG